MEKDNDGFNLINGICGDKEKLANTRVPSQDKPKAQQPSDLSR